MQSDRPNLIVINNEARNGPPMDVPDNTIVELRGNAVLHVRSIGKNVIFKLFDRSSLAQRQCVNHELKDQSRENKVFIDDNVTFELNGHSEAHIRATCKDNTKFKLFAHSHLNFSISSGNNVPSREFIDAIEMSDTARITTGKKLLRGMPLISSGVSIAPGAVNISGSNVVGAVIGWVSGDAQVIIGESYGHFSMDDQVQVQNIKFDFDEYRQIPARKDSDFDDFYQRAQKFVAEKKAAELEKLLKENFYHRYTTQPFIRKFFVSETQKFLDLFCQVKDNAEMVNAFEAAFAADWTEVVAKWDGTTVRQVVEAINQLDEKGKTLKQEGANADASEVCRLSTKVKSILHDPSAEEEGKQSDKFTLNQSPTVAQRIEFAATMMIESRQRIWDNHRKPGWVFAKNVLLFILGAGILYGLAVLAKGNYLCAETKRREIVHDLRAPLQRRELRSS